ncbi:hypothetical protein [Pseudonocardia broussonetiae]|uniref:Transcriptional regulator, AbiEi antitoxin, Type IV TA system n=1 Tax=Pseudonocardia broussonetiae TaxID=2736640 RepID=A0A6M6JMG3_9PSEU|nr:hypothetical protein [Pseudonocardia broussonetiae]QJY48515.1 hypothetical protein HOP40_24260 [Pseudonocardia broussonetiae]
MTSAFHRRPDLLAAGVREHELRRRLRTGELVRLRRGHYLAERPTGPEQWHRARALAAAPDLAPDAVLSHVTAAVLHGLPVWDLPLDRVHSTRPRRSGARVGRFAHVHAAQLDPDEVVEVDGARVTSVARTLADVGRSAPFEQAVVVADAALHRHLVSREELDAALARGTRRPGTPAADRALRFAAAGSMSVGESRSRVAMHLAGLPAPVLQWPVVTAAAWWWARSTSDGRGSAASASSTGA